ncbi:MAG: M50 family metallopeptidase [Firmicutes bacterium]|nr:M50 family metallopeptidase [Bacillota bacterium]
MRVGSLLGVPVAVNPWFLVILFLLATVGLLPQALVLFTSVFFHEFAHTLIARTHGLRSSQIELLPFGGVASIDELGGLDPGLETSVALAGPVASGILAAVCWLIQNNWPLYPELVTYGIYSNLALAGFNLLPALPLDGGRLLRAHLAGKRGFRGATRAALGLARILAVLLMVGGIIGLHLGALNISFPVVGVFLWLAARREEYNSRYLFVQYITKRRQELGTGGPKLVESILCPASMPVKEVVRHFLPQNYHLVYLLGANKELLGYVTELEVIEAMLEKGIDTPLEALPVHPLGRE